MSGFLWVSGLAYRWGSVERPGGKGETHLDFGLEDDVRVTGVREAEDPSELIRREFSNFQDLELGGLQGEEVSGKKVDGHRRLTWVPMDSSMTWILSAMMRGLLPLLRAALRSSVASAWN